MKYKPKIYAKALLALMRGEKPAVQARAIAKQFFGLLAKNGDLKKAKEILAIAEVLLLQETGNKKITLESARDVETQKLLKHFSREGDIIEKKINPEIIAGVKVTVDTVRQLDFSLQKKLNEIFESR